MRVTVALVPGSLGDAVEVVVGDIIARHEAWAREAVEETRREVADDYRLLARLREDERLAALWMESVEAAAMSSLAEKRRLLGRAIARAVLDDAMIDETQLIVAALRELDVPHVRALERIRRAEDEAAAQATREDEVNKAVREAGSREPIPVLSALIRTGVTIPATPFLGAGVGIHRLSPFGRSLLDELRPI